MIARFRSSIPVMQGAGFGSIRDYEAITPDQRSGLAASRCHPTGQGAREESLRCGQICAAIRVSWASLGVFAPWKSLISHGVASERTHCDSGCCGFESHRPPQ
jgi:hypothetical protein